MTSKPLCILLVDDDPDTRAVFHDILEYAGIALLTADSERAMRTILEKTRPDLIILDIFLPDTDGYQLLDVIRTLPGMQICPVIATTGYYTTDSAGQLRERGFDGVLLKPLNPETIADSLRGWIAPEAD